MIANIENEQNENKKNTKTANQKAKTTAQRGTHAILTPRVLISIRNTRVSATQDSKETGSTVPVSNWKIEKQKIKTKQFICVDTNDTMFVHDIICWCLSCRI